MNNYLMLKSGEKISKDFVSKIGFLIFERNMFTRTSQKFKIEQEVESLLKVLQTKKVDRITKKTKDILKKLERIRNDGNELSLPVTRECGLDREKLPKILELFEEHNLITKTQTKNKYFLAGSEKKRWQKFLMPDGFKSFVNYLDAGEECQKQIDVLEKLCKIPAEDLISVCIVKEKLSQKFALGDTLAAIAKVAQGNFH